MILNLECTSESPGGAFRKHKCPRSQSRPVKSKNLSGVGVEKEKYEKLPWWFCLPRLGTPAYKCKIILCQQALGLLGISFSGWSSSTFKSSDDNLVDCLSHVWGAALFTNLFVLGMPPSPLASWKITACLQEKKNIGASYFFIMPSSKSLYKDI